MALLQFAVDILAPLVQKSDPVVAAVLLVAVIALGLVALALYVVLAMIKAGKS